MDQSEVGLNYLRIVWFLLAQKLVEKAVEVYNLDPEQANALRKVYLKPNHYYIEIES
jgi:hypothetical protein